MEANLAGLVSAAISVDMLISICRKISTELVDISTKMQAANKQVQLDNPVNISNPTLELESRVEAIAPLAIQIPLPDGAPNGLTVEMERTGAWHQVFAHCEGYVILTDNSGIIRYQKPFRTGSHDTRSNPVHYIPKVGAGECLILIIKVAHFASGFGFGTVGANWISIKVHRNPGPAAENGARLGLRSEQERVRAALGADGEFALR